jgi:heterodisulfide reductase subunit A
MKRADDSTLLVRYEREDGCIEEKPFDLIVLSVGFEPRKGNHKILSLLGLDLDEMGFVKTDPLYLSITKTKGIYVCGGVSGPKDIQATIIQAGDAGSHASSILIPYMETQKKEISRWSPLLQDEELRAGVFICNCCKTMKDCLNMDELLAYSMGQPNVIHAGLFDILCNKNGLRDVLNIIKDRRLNGIVIAACSPMVFNEKLFKELPEGFPIDPCLQDIVNLREEIAWVHSGEKVLAFRKAKAMISASLSRLRNHIPIGKFQIRSSKGSALVIGGGLAGLTASLRIASQGYRVDLVEKENELGGNLRYIFYTLDGEVSPQGLLKNLIEDVKKNPLINCYTNSILSAIDGFPGNFNSIITQLDKGDRISLRHAVVVIATGAMPYRPDEYLYGHHKRVMTQRELEGMISINSKELEEIREIVMIQCVGSRNEKNPYCSRICCASALKNAIRIKDLYPDKKIFILYRDMMTFGIMESHYRKAREKGVIFLRFDLEYPPEVRILNGSFEVSTKEPVLDTILRIKADLIVLSTGIEAGEGNLRLAEIMGCNVDKTGFFSEINPKFRPLDLKEGIFVCGLAHSPLFIQETISQANASAMRAIAFLSRNDHLKEGHAQVKEKICSACGLCVKICPSGARFIEQGERYARVINEICKGCGTCVSICPNHASQLTCLTDRQVFSMIDAIMDIR